MPIVNVIMCEDIREEVNNKKSLMGVIPGDLTLGSLPATIQMAIYIEYVPVPEDGNHISLKARMTLGDIDIGTGGGESGVDQVVVFVFPRGLLTIQQEARLKVYVAVNGRDEQEVLNKRVVKVQPSTP